jgi:hypothetical protein
MKLENVSKYIDENKKLPSSHDKNDSIKTLEKWVSHQKTNYEKKEQIMKNPEIRVLWEKFIEKYSEYFISNEEQWKNKLENVCEYIDENNKLPSTIDKNDSIKKLGYWVSTQKKNYEKKQFIMKNSEICELWEKFMEKYSEYFEKWKNNLKEIIEYINKNNKLPSEKNKNDSTKKLGQWITAQKKNYAKKEKIMKSSQIRKLWEEFQEKYFEYFISNEEKWKNNLKEICKYIDENDKLPSQSDNNDSIKKLGQWITTQKKNYAKKEKIMKNYEIYELWEKFMEKYFEYFISNEEQWKNNLKKISKYIDLNNKLPSRIDENDSIKKLSIWLSTQKENYAKKEQIMKKSEICELWEKFIEKYFEYFISNEEKWKNNLKEICEYIDETDKLPSQSDNNDSIKKLGYWLSHQKINYAKKENIMKNQEIRKLWEEFQEKYSEY